MSIKFKVRFLPYDSYSKNLVQDNKYNAMLDIILSRKKSWRSVVDHLESKWKAISNLRENIRVYCIDETTSMFTSNVLLSSGGLSSNVHDVLKSLHVAPISVSVPGAPTTDGASADMEIFQCCYQFDTTPVDSSSEGQLGLGQLPSLPEVTIVPSTSLEELQMCNSRLVRARIEDTAPTALTLTSTVGAPGAYNTATSFADSRLAGNVMSTHEATSASSRNIGMLSPSTAVVMQSENSQNTMQMLNSFCDFTNTGYSNAANNPDLVPAAPQGPVLAPVPDPALEIAEPAPCAQHVSMITGTVANDTLKESENGHSSLPIQVTAVATGATPEPNILIPRRKGSKRQTQDPRMSALKRDHSAMDDAGGGNSNSNSNSNSNINFSTAGSPRAPYMGQSTVSVSEDDNSIINITKDGKLNSDTVGVSGRSSDLGVHSDASSHAASNAGRSSAFSGRISTDVLKSIVRSLTPRDIPATATATAVAVAVGKKSSSVVSATTSSGAGCEITGAPTTSTSNIPVSVSETPANAASAVPTPTITTVASVTRIDIDPTASSNPMSAFYTDQGLISSEIKRYYCNPERDKRNSTATTATTTTTTTTNTTSTATSQSDGYTNKEARGTSTSGSNLYKKKRRITPTFIGHL